jgi:N6-L-threonylcarbamoyladenine synthase
MKILAIETSCDESSLSLFTATETSSGVDFEVSSTITQSQIDLHKDFGGVFPAMGRREHQKNLVPILLKILDQEVLANAGPVSHSEIEQILAREAELLTLFTKYVTPIKNPGIDYVCVTSGPGLEPALWVGISFAKALGALWDIPVIPVNHMEGHILSVLVPESATGNSNSFSVQTELFPFPALALLISGGHTEIVLVKNIGDYEIIGRTRDDAIGEAFDKVARILGLPYPGGPEVSKMAALYLPPLLGGGAEVRGGGGNTDTTSPSQSSGTRPLKDGERIHLPRPMIHSKDYDFSFSGLKTAVLYFVKEHTANPDLTISNAFADKGYDANRLSDEMKAAIAYEFQEAAAEVITKKTLSAIHDFGIQTLIVGGGVSANKRIKESLMNEISEVIPAENIHFPTRELTGDNALMIGLAGYYKIKKAPDTVYNDIRAEGNLTF